VGIERIGAFGAVEVVLPESRVVTTGRRKTIVHSALTLRRGLTSTTEWYDWWFESRRRRAGSARRVTLELLDAAGVARLRWFFPDCVPQAYAVSPLSALREAVVLESLELAVGDFVLQKLQ
jgi:phage tail-like protein